MVVPKGYLILITIPNKPYDTLVTKISFCHNSSFNKKGSLVSSRARFFNSEFRNSDFLNSEFWDSGSIYIGLPLC